MADNTVSRTGMELDGIPEDGVRSCDVCGKRFLRGWSATVGFSNFCDGCLHDTMERDFLTWYFADAANTVAIDTHNWADQRAYLHVYYSSEHGCWLPC